MEREAVFVGLDYHDKSVQVAVMDQAGTLLANRSCNNDLESIRSTVSGYGQVKRAAIEACAGAADLAEKLADSGWSIDMAHSTYVAAMKRSPDKCDWTDGKLLADLTRVGYLPKVWIPPKPIRELRRLVRYRYELVMRRKDTKLRIRALLREHRIEGRNDRPWTKSWFTWIKALPLAPESRWVLDQRLAELEHLSVLIVAAETKLDATTSDDPVVKKLREQPGIGPVTSWVLRAEIGRFDRFVNGKQLAKFCGVTPRNASSGEKQADAGLINTGCPLLRNCVIEAAQRLARYTTPWKNLAQRLRRRGKPGTVIIAAVANRWMRWLHHVMVKPEICS